MKRAAAICLLAISSNTHAAETLNEVVGEPVTAEGMTAAALVDRGVECLQAASGNVADKVTPLRDGDTAYAIVITGYKAMMTARTVRSRMSIQAKDGRFRVVHSDVDWFRELTNDWGPVYMYAGAGGKQAKAALEARSTAVTECMLKKPEAAGGDW